MKVFNFLTFYSTLIHPLLGNPSDASGGSGRNFSGSG